MDRLRLPRVLAGSLIIALAACAAPTTPVPSPSPVSATSPSAVASAAPSAAPSTAVEPSAAPSTAVEPSVAASTPAASAAVSDAPVPSLPAAAASVSYGGVSFAYDPAIVGTPTGATVPPMEYFADTLPAFTEFKFANGTNTEGFQGWLRVFNVADFDALPASYRETMDRREPMPPLHAARILDVQRADLAFASGTGTRSVVFYTQNLTPFTNDSLFYSYQGLTADGTRYVSLALPISVALLPDSIQQVLAGEFPALPSDSANADAFTAAIQAFNETMTAQLDALPADAFAPALGQLDALSQSITVTQP